MRVKAIVASLAALVAVSLVGGCVSQGTYDELAKDHSDLGSKLADLEGRCEADLAALRATEGKLRQQLLKARDDDESMDRRIAGLLSEMSKLREEHAQALKSSSKLKASVADMQSALEEAQRRKAQAEAREAEYKDLLARFQSLIDSGRLRVRIIDGRMVVQLATDVLFGSGQSKLSPEGVAAIQEIGSVLGSIADRRYEVAGHTDNIAMRRGDGNWILAFQRANSVVQAMIGGGMPAGRVHAASYGEHRPVASNEEPDGRALNRRIEIVIVPDLSMLPGAEELEKLGG